MLTDISPNRIRAAAVTGPREPSVTGSHRSPSTRSIRTSTPVTRARANGNGPRAVNHKRVYDQS